MTKNRLIHKTPKKTMLKKTILNKINFNKVINTMRGGKFLGEGSFGCVVSPALSCESNSDNAINKKSKFSKKNRTSNKTVSKIVLSPDDDIKDEIDISLKLKRLDPNQKQFITLNEYCKLKHIPNNRSNIAKVRYMDNSGSYYQKLERKSLDKKYCPVDLTMKPINLIMPYGGYDLIEIADVVNKYGLNTKQSQKLNPSTKHKLTTARMLFMNIKECVKNLLKGLLKMHQNRIVNRDIKEENIMANYDESKKTITTRYIDYGLSENLTPEFCSHYSNINMHGTYLLMAPEIFIVYYLKKYNGYSDEYIMNKINNDIQNYVRRMLKDLKLDVSELQGIVKLLYFNIKKMFQEQTILPKYYGTPEDPLNGYLQKNDVYSLGLTLYEFLVIYTEVINVKDDLRLHDLLKNMIELNPDKRFNALQCINHPYFQT